MTLVRGNLEMQGKYTSRPGLTDDGQAASHDFGEVLSQGESQTGSVDLRSCCLRGTIERLEDMLQLRARYTDAVVLDGDRDLASLVSKLLQLRPEVDATVCPAIFDGIGNEIL